MTRARRFGRGSSALVLGATLAATALAAPPPGWWEEAKIQVRVHDHVFHRVTLNGHGCAVRVRLHFDAPPSGYSEPAPERNHYRFIVKVSVVEGLEGHSFVSDRPIDNREAGARVIAFKHDTTEQGCWAERQPSLREVDVHACRGAGCVPTPFE